jgi:ATP-dependent Clp protease adaptor protein ClpS
MHASIESEPQVQTAHKPRTAPEWKVILINDPITTFEFVTELLVTLFHKEPPEARRLMLEVHEQGSALITVTNLERAELYLEQIRSLSRPRGFPLNGTIEPA